jgi:hypothetical protein
MLDVNSYGHAAYLSALITFFPLFLRTSFQTSKLFLVHYAIIIFAEILQHFSQMLKKHRGDILTALSAGEDTVVPAHDIMAYGGWKVELHSFLTTGLDKGECSDLYTDCLIAGRGTPVHTE